MDTGAVKFIIVRMADEGGSQKGTMEAFRLQTRSDHTYRVHIWKVVLGVSIIVAIVAFVVAGFFYPECNATQNRGFYSCPCKPGSVWDESRSLCICLDTGATPATDSCASAMNDVRFVFEDLRDSDGEWTTVNQC